MSDAVTPSILVAEDDALVRRVIVRRLTRQGYHVIEASDPKKALEQILNTNAALCLVISDVGMTGMNGRDFVARLRERYPSIIALFMSGYTRETLIEQGLITIDDHFLDKTEVNGSLLDKVASLLS